MLIIDFETRSRCDLKKHGAYIYAADPSTDIICMSAVDTQSSAEWLWYPGNTVDTGDYDTQLPFDLFEAILAAPFIVAHNVEFDRLIWEYVAVPDYGFPEICPSKWYCSMAHCRVNGLPAALDDAAWALGLKNRKHAGGKNLIKQLSIPQDDGTFNKDPKLIKEMGAYCLQDSIVVKDILACTRSMTADEHKDWLVNFRINDRGVRLDMQLAKDALQYADEEQAEIGDLLSELTEGKITKHTQTARIREYLIDILPGYSPVIDAMVVYKKGVKKFSLDKSVRKNILAMDDISDKVFELVDLLDDGNKSSVAKFKRMRLLADPDDQRARGVFHFAGAAATLRYTSRGIQLHNMRREC